MKNEIKENKLTPNQFIIIEKIKDFLSNLSNLYEIKGNSIYIKDIDIFEIINKEIKKDNSSIVTGMDYIYTEINFLNNKNTILEFDKGEYVKIINNSSIIEYIKFNIKKILG